MVGGDNPKTDEVPVTDHLIKAVYVDSVEHVSEIVNEIQSTLASSNPVADILKSLLQDLQQAIDRFDTAWPSYQALFDSDVSHLDSTMRDYRAICRLSRKTKNELLGVLASLAAPPVAPSTPSAMPLPKPRLPEIKLPEFDGDSYQRWPAFWDLYVSLVHGRTDLSDVIKFSVLRSSLKGNAYQVVEGLSVTEQNYSVAINLLKDTYEDNSRLSRSLLREFNNLPAPKHNVKELLSFRLSYQKLLLQIGNTGINVNQSHTFITSIVTQKLSSETSKLLIHKYQTFDLTLNQISEGLKYVIDLIEYCKEQDQQNKPKIMDPKSVQVATVVAKTDQSVRQKTKPSKSVNPGNSQPQKPSNSGSNLSQSRPCIFCQEDHAPKYCKNYPAVDLRKVRIKELRLCFSCLHSGHVVADCKIKVKCRHCDGNHHTFLCYKLYSTNAINPNKPQSVPESQNQNVTPQQPPQTQSNSGASNPSVNVQSKVASVQHPPNMKLESTAIPTATVQVSGGGTKLYKRSFFDTGSQRSFIDPSLVRELNLEPLDQITLSISPFGSEPVTVVCDLVKVVVRLGKIRVTIKALVHDNLDTTIRTPGIAKVAKSLRRKGVKLADRHLDSDDVDNIRLVIGVDYYHKFIYGQSHPMGINVFNTPGGALIYGPMPHWSCPEQTANSVSVQSSVCARVGVLFPGSEINQISNLWNMDAIGIKQSDFSPEEKNTIQQFEKSIHKVGNQYEVDLPFKSDDRPLTNYRVAVGQMNSLVCKMRDDESLYTHYSRIFSEYLEHGFIEPVPSTELIKGHYLPYHHVKKESTTTPIRIVFNASSKTAGTLSLNDCLHTGPTLTTKMFESLLTFRTNPFVAISDISKAFLRLLISESSRDWCRFVWLSDPEDPSSLVTYRFKVVCFGATCSPFLLQKTLDFHFSHHNHPLARSLMSCFYVDNFLRTYENVEQLFAEYPIINKILDQAGMPLQEWMSNNSDFNECVQAAELINSKNGVISVLGVNWKILSDTLIIKPCKMTRAVITKRSIVSCVASVFDPLGLVSPTIVLGKILISDLWRSNLDWDDPVTQEFVDRFRFVQEQLSQVNKVEFQRFVVTPNKCHLHVFCDASAKAFGAVAYSVDLNNLTSNLLVGKARVCPQQKLTMPKLELTSVNIGCKLAQTLMNHSSFNFLSCTIWSDSEVTIARIKSDKCKDPYVRNRVREIKSLNFSIKYVPTKQNPADLVSRGCEIKDLDASTLWKHGPNWLIDQNYPPQKDYLVDYSLPVVASEIIVEPLNVDPPPVIIKVDRYSYLSQVKRVWLAVVKFLHLNISYQFPLDPLIYLVRLEQRQHYPSLFAYLQNNKIKVASDIKNLAFQLDLYLDQHNLIRSKGRIQHANLCDTAKVPYLLPPRSHLTTLIVRHYHILNHHCHANNLLGLVREQFCIPKPRQVLKSIVKKCVFCKRVDGKPATNPGPPPLPIERVTLTRPYACVGVDYTGAINYVDSDQNVQHKAYLCLFTCASTRAVHLELVPTLSASDFMLCFRRFCALYSVPEQIISDNGRNFVGFHHFWKQILDEPEVKAFMLNHSVKWKFIVPRAPWKGGLYERLIGVVKGCLAKALYRKTVSYEELRTLLTEFACVVNNRPLTYISEGSDECLTPAHLVFGRTVCMSPPLNHLADDELPYEEDLDLREQYSRLTSVLRKFEKSWNSDYLTALRERHYNCAPHQECVFKEGDLVLIDLDAHSRKWWPLGRIKRLISSADGVIRSVEVKVGDSTYHRSLSKLVPLEIGTSEPGSIPAPEEVCDPVEVPAVAAQLPPTPLARPRPKRRAAAQCDANRKILLEDDSL